MEFVFEYKPSYGNHWYYPVCENAKFLCKLMGKRKALTEAQINDIEEHGWGIILK